MRSVLHTQGDSRPRSCPVVSLVPPRVMDDMLPALVLSRRHVAGRFIIIRTLYMHLHPNRESCRLGSTSQRTGGTKDESEPEAWRRGRDDPPGRAELR